MEPDDWRKGERRGEREDERAALVPATRQHDIVAPAIQPVQARFVADEIGRRPRRAEELAKTAEAVIGGELSRRVPVRGTGDEFDRLAQRIARFDQVVTL